MGALEEGETPDILYQKRSTHVRPGQRDTLRRGDWKVPKMREREAIVRAAHAQGHASTSNMISTIQKEYNWPRLREEVAQYVEHYEVCQKADPVFYKVPVLTQPPIYRAFGRWGVDLITHFGKTTAGNWICISAIDYQTKWVELGALSNKRSATVAKWFEDNVVLRFPIPDEVMVDQGPEFKKDFISMLGSYKINRRRARARHPQSNGLVERMNRTINTVVKKLTHDRKQEWDVLLPKVASDIRCFTQNSTGFTPFEMAFGRTPTFIRDKDIPWWVNSERVLDLPDRLKRLNQITAQARENLRQAQIQQQRQYQKRTITQLKKISRWVQIRKRTKDWLDWRTTGPYKVLGRTADGLQLKVEGFEQEWIRLDDAAPWKGPEDDDTFEPPVIRGKSLELVQSIATVDESTEIGDSSGGGATPSGRSSLSSKGSSTVSEVSE